jgi:hypothetical protein
MSDNLYNPVGFPATPDRPAPRRGPSVLQVHGIFFVLAFVLGGAAALYAYAWTGSIALPIFLFGMIQFYVGRGLGDVATDRQKLRRLAYFSLLPLTASALLWATYHATGLMWLGAIVGFVLGVVLWNIIATVAFTDIHREEYEDTRVRQRDDTF